MKVDIKELNFNIECIEGWEKDVSGKSLNASEILYKYHELAEIILNNPKAYFETDFIAKYNELKWFLEDNSQCFRLVVDYGNDNILLPYILAEDGQFFCPCFENEEELVNNTLAKYTEIINE